MSKKGPGFASSANQPPFTEKPTQAAVTTPEPAKPQVPPGGKPVRIEDLHDGAGTGVLP